MIAKKIPFFILNTSSIKRRIGSDGKDLSPEALFARGH
jgi:hypothetical protein